MIDDTRLAERLRDTGLLSDQKIEQARLLQEREDRSLYEVLIAHRLVEEGPLVAIVSDVLNVASVDPREFDPDGEILDLVPASVAFDNWALPLETEQVDGQARLVLAMRDPIDMMAMDEIANYTDIDIRPVLAGPRALHDALVDSYDEIDASGFDVPEGLDSGTHPGLVTSDAGEDEAGAVDAGEPLETKHESMAAAATDGGEQLYDSNPAAPADSDLGEPSEPEERTADPDTDAIGRIPIKQVPASELADDSSGAAASLDEPSSAPGSSEAPIDLGTPISSSERENLEESSTGGGTVVAEAPKVDGAAPSPTPGAPTESSAGSDAVAPPAPEAPDEEPPADQPGAVAPPPPEPEEEPPDDQSGAVAPPPPESDEDEEDEDTSRTDTDESSADELSENDPDDTSGADEATADAEKSDEEEPDDEESDGGGSLASLRERLDTNKSAGPTTDETDGFVDRVADVAGSLDDEAREQLESASPTQLARAAVLALLENGAISADDLIDGLPTDD